MPANLQSALRNRNNTGIPQARTTIYQGSSKSYRTFPMIMNPCTNDDTLRDVLLRSEGVMTRVRMINASLRLLGINCSELDTLAGAGSVQLASVQEMAHVKNHSGLRTSLTRFRMTVITMRDAYRDILVREDLPGETAQGVLSVAQSLDVTAVKAAIA
ncbi:MAG: hypothetical protein CVV32_12335 [Methanomicrobiales archaeon HGW-Methanomicrobiales-3]|jgi:hypothetical protein|nr:MAG: hypothetical protein CVV32_12335 [Methanomicrobiales archaeon HGW-Methanomicrobiales-3]